jgi:hypothetical protein
MLMATASWSKRLFVLGMGGLAVLASCLGGMSVAQPKKAADPKDWKYLGAGQCMQCHTEGPRGNRNEQFALMTEYATWRIQDKHSLAFLVLKGPRGTRVGELLKTDVTKPAAGCLNCHSMWSVQESGRGGDDFELADGVSCDACHGPASEWLFPHQQPKAWRKKSAKEKQELGMTDLRDPVTRAKVCTSCHVGDATQGKVVTHAMFAAGHPPLPPFELAVFSKALPQHWREKRDVPFLRDPALQKDYDKEDIAKKYHLDAAAYQQTQLSLATSLIGLHSSMNLVAGRSELEAADRLRRWPELALPFFKQDEDLNQLWPEVAMAHSDCFACHHELRRKPDGYSWRQERGYAGKPGRPQIRAWSFALPNQGLGLGEGEENLRALHKGIARLIEACDDRPFGAPSKVADAARGLKEWSTKQVEAHDLQDAKPDRVELLRRLCTLPPNAYPDYESAWELVMTCQVIYQDLPAEAKSDKVQEALGKLLKDFSRYPGSARDKRVLLVKKEFEKFAKGRYLEDNKALEALLWISDHSLAESFPDQNEDKEKQKVGAEVRAFLGALGMKSPKEMVTFFQEDEEFLAALKQLGDEELKEELQKIAAYDPTTFRDQMKKLAGLLGQR